MFKADFWKKARSILRAITGIVTHFCLSKKGTFFITFSRRKLTLLAEEKSVNKFIRFFTNFIPSQLTFSHLLSTISFQRNREKTIDNCFIWCIVWYSPRKKRNQVELSSGRRKNKEDTEMWVEASVKIATLEDQPLRCVWSADTAQQLVKILEFYRYK